MMLVLAAVGAGAGFAIVKATGGSGAPLNDCAAQLAKTQRRLTLMDGKLTRLRRDDAALLAAFRALSGQLKAIERKYPSNELPEPVYVKYKKIQRASDAAYVRYSRSIDRTNALISARNAVATRFNKAAACKPSP
jgi:hypothetical protein